VEHAQEQGLSERRACRLVNQPRGTQRNQPTQREDEDALTQAIISLASQYGRYGFRRITALLKRDSWQGIGTVLKMTVDRTGNGDLDFFGVKIIGGHMFDVDLRYR